MPDTSQSSLNPPKQSRSRRTLERIVTAALELLAAEGPSAVTVQAVVSRANSSVGSFYARFRGKDDLLEYLGERVWEDALGRWNEAISSKTWSDMDLAEVTEGAVGLLTDIRRSRVAQLRALDELAVGGKAYETFRQHVMDSLEALLLERQHEMQHPNPELAVRLGLSAVLGVIDAELEDSEGSDVPREAVVHECTDLLLGYFSGASRGAGGHVDFFDVWA